MKVGLVIESFDPGRGGAEAWTFHHAQNLLARGHEVHVVAQEIAPEARRLPVVLHRLEKTFSPIARAQAAEAKLRTLKLDVIHDMGLGWYSHVFQPHGGCWTAITQQKLLLTPPWLRPLKRRVDPLLPRYRRLQRLARRQTAPFDAADCAAFEEPVCPAHAGFEATPSSSNEPGRGNRILLALSHKVAEEFQMFHNIPPERIRVVYNGVDVQQFSPQRRAEFRQNVRRTLGIGENTVLALAVAHNFHLKGVLTLLRALQILAPKRLPLHAVVVGGKRLLSWRMWAKVRRLPVTFAGAQKDTVPFYAAADMLVHPSFYDSCSLVLLEGAASGLPLLVSRENGAAELLSHGQEGLLLDDSTNARMLAAQMEMLMDAPLRRRMGAAARRLAVEHTTQRNCDEILGIYNQVIQSRRQAA